MAQDHEGKTALDMTDNPTEDAALLDMGLTVVMLKLRMASSMYMNHGPDFIFILCFSSNGFMYYNGKWKLKSQRTY